MGVSKMHVRIYSLCIDLLYNFIIFRRQMVEIMLKSEMVHEISTLTTKLIATSNNYNMKSKNI